MGDVEAEPHTENVSETVAELVAEAAPVAVTLGVADTVGETLSVVLTVPDDAKLALPRPVPLTVTLKLAVPLVDAEAALELLAAADEDTLNVAHAVPVTLPEKQAVAVTLTEAEGVLEEAPDPERDTLGEALRDLMDADAPPLLLTETEPVKLPLRDEDPVTVGLGEREPVAEGEKLLVPVPVLEAHAEAVKEALSDAPPEPDTVVVPDTVGVPDGEKEKDAVAVVVTVCVAQADTVPVAAARLGDLEPDCEGELEEEAENWLAVPVDELEPHAEELPVSVAHDAEAVADTLTLGVSWEEALLEGEVEGLPVTDGVNVSVAVLDGDAVALCDARPDAVKDAVVVPLLQSELLGVKEAEAVTVPEPDTVGVVEGVYEKLAVAVVVPHAVPEGDAEKDFTEGVAVLLPVTHAVADSDAVIEVEAVLVGQPLAVYEKDAVLLVVPVPHEDAEAVFVPVTDGVVEALPEADTVLDADAVPHTVVDADTVPVGEKEKEDVEDAVKEGVTVELADAVLLADTVELTDADTVDVVDDEKEALTVEEPLTVDVGVMEKVDVGLVDAEVVAVPVVVAVADADPVADAVPLAEPVPVAEPEAEPVDEELDVEEPVAVALAVADAESVVCSRRAPRRGAANAGGAAAEGAAPAACRARPAPSANSTSTPSGRKSAEVGASKIINSSGSNRARKRTGGRPLRRKDTPPRAETPRQKAKAKTRASRTAAKRGVDVIVACVAFQGGTRFIANIGIGARRANGMFHDRIKLELHKLCPPTGTAGNLKLPGRDTYLYRGLSIMLLYLLFCLPLSATVRVPSADPAFLRPSHAQRWEVLLGGGGSAPPEGAPSPPLSLHTMVDGSGARWQCAVPMGGGGGGGSGGGSPPAPGAPLERALAVLGALRAQEACALRVTGYWTFQVCAGGRVRQFHYEEPTALADRSLDLGAHVPARDRVESLPGGTRALSQRFEGGDGGRAADVQWVCAGGGGGSAATAPAPAPPALELLSVEEAPELAYTLRVGVRSAALCAALPSPPALLAPINGTCIEHSPGGWWSYSVCLGREVTQFHAQDGKRVQETVLGRYDWAAGEALAGEVGAAPPDAAAEPPRAGAPPPPPPLGAAAAILQSYVGGEPCNVRGGTPRAATVRFECVPLGAGALGEETVGALSLTFLHMREAPTCVYTFVFGSPLPCEVTAPATAHLPPPPVTLIDCQPA